MSRFWKIALIVVAVLVVAAVGVRLLHKPAPRPGAQAGAQAATRRAELARETRGFFDKSFRLGESDLPTRLRVELDAAEAERQSARARLAVQQAVSALRQALGQLPD